ncbi:PqqD family protein [Hyphomicrobium sp. B1]|jgi:hypothetical protein|uniref:PqqD family protein n=1 Tax=unclassified Hyphomicrobium TaxID=2619925 RepID=UPI000213E89E|nr:MULTISPECIES: PqqD family protein [unclassified Hyphomicrobium]CCB64708.1 protein of unknown function [Hyphomicrobium sp. MC1]
MLHRTVPRQAFGFFTEEMDGESVLFRLGRPKAIHLNETAALIWKLSDGTRSVQDLIDFLKAEYPDAQSDVEVDVERAVADLMRVGALLSTEAKSATP